MHGNVLSQKFFVSHQSHDTDDALKLVSMLEAMGHRTKVDVLDFHAGQSFLDQMMIGLQESEYVICVISDDFFASEYCLLELYTALNRSPLGRTPKLFLVRFKDCTIPDMFSTSIYIDLRNLDEADSRKRLERQLISAITGRRPGPLNPKSPHVAADDETMVIFTKFRQLEGTSRNPGELWPYVLRNEIKAKIESENVGFLELPEVITSESNARELIETHNATMLLWGAISERMIEVNYLLNLKKLPFDIKPNAAFGHTYIRANSDIEFRAFIDSAGDSEFVLTILLGCLNMAASRFDKAINRFKTATNYVLTHDVETVIEFKIFLARALCHLSRNDVASAIEDLNIQLEICPTDVQSLEYRGACLVDAGYPEQGLADFDQIVNFDPDSIRVRHERALVNMSLGIHDACEADLHIILQQLDKLPAEKKLDTVIGYYYSMLAVTQQRQGKTKEAWKSYCHAASRMDAKDVWIPEHNQYFGF